MDAYRKDIDGLRAIAVLSVIAFHFGLLPNGYLGVDVFFTISGYLITGIIYKETAEGRFSIIQFYLRRTRRIIPLILLISFISLIIGMAVMLPDDLENLSQSVIATNLFSNNILQLITTRNYWDVVNEFKPLMHTWSLGIEEQYYLLYPFLFLIIGRKRKTWVLPVLLLLTLISLLLFLSPFFSSPAKYYLIPFRFFELSIGGIGAILCKDKTINKKYAPLFLAALIAIISMHIKQVPGSLETIIVVLITIGLLVTTNDQNKMSSRILENKLMVSIGKLSFSLYMWHQLILSYTRYFIVQETTISSLALVFISIVALSVLSYYFIEQPFRDKTRIMTTTLLWVLGLTFMLTTVSATVIYFRAGVIRDVPELDITTTEVKRNMHAQYNASVKNYDKAFTDTKKLKVLVIGNSYARDWANVLLESKFRKDIELSYINYLSKSGDHLQRSQQADLIFFTELDRSLFIRAYKNGYNIDTSKVWCVGIKNFGISNGLFYNHKRDKEYFMQRAPLRRAYLMKNDLLKKQWSNKYIDLAGMYVDSNGTFPIFTPDRKFISQDCRHLTKAGAKYFATLIGSDPGFVLNRFVKPGYTEPTQ